MQSARDKWYRSRVIQAALLTGIFSLICSLLTLVVSSPRRDHVGSDSASPELSSSTTKPSKDSLVPSHENPGSQRSSLESDVASRLSFDEDKATLRKAQGRNRAQKQAGATRVADPPANIRPAQSTIKAEIVAGEVNQPPAKEFTSPSESVIKPEVSPRQQDPQSDNQE